MTITLDDLPTLVDILVMGRSVSRPQRLIDAKNVLINLFGVSAQDARDELGLIRGSSVRLEWLRSKFSYVTDARSGRRIQCAASVGPEAFHHSFDYMFRCNFSSNLCLYLYN